METFSVLLALCAGNSPVTGEFPSQRPVTRSFGVFFDLRLNKRLSKHSWGWWFETPSRPLWRHCNGNDDYQKSRKWHAVEVVCTPLSICPSQCPTQLTTRDVLTEVAARKSKDEWTYFNILDTFWISSVLRIDVKCVNSFEKKMSPKTFIWRFKSVLMISLYAGTNSESKPMCWYRLDYRSISLILGHV